ncbi:MAG: Asp-tRNA(Asn)/Glu-tRNA(Gln) amidotransferase subunit GatA [Desulfovibrio sp.]
MSELYTKNLVEIRDLLASKEVSCEEVTRSCVDRIDATEPQIEALLSVQSEQALKAAAELDAAGPDGRSLWGVPLIYKDVLTTKGTTTTCGSKILENFVPFYNATSVARLHDAGAVMLAKANMDEFAMGSSNENSAYKSTKNPWDLTKVPGGSSGGSAACVAAKQCFGALGTDTGGSIRQPASFCGIVGLKPTYGRISRFGLVAYGSSLDQIGPMTRTVADSALLLQNMAGHDHRDSTCADVPVPDYMAALDEMKDLSGITIGLPEEYWAEGMDAEVEEACRAVITKAEALGAKTVPVNLNMTEYAIAMYYIIAMAESSSNLSRFDGVRYGHRNKEADELIDLYTKSRTEGFGDEVQRRIILGTYVLSSGYYDAYYMKAAQVRRLLRKDFEEALSKCDVIAAPVSPTTAFGLNDKVSDPLQMYLMDIYTISLNLAGLPGLSIPAGLGKESGMPVGLQFMGSAFDEAKLLQVGNVLEKNMETLPEPAGLK